MRHFINLLLILSITSSFNNAVAASPTTQAKHRVIVSTDIGGSDFDDFQSLVHLLLYADTLAIEGIISSPFGKGRKQDILQVLAHYETDYPNLKTYSDDYPTPSALRALVKQGETQAAPYAGFRQATEGSNWIIAQARLDDPRPLHILVWGGIEDLAQALHDAPDILAKLRVYYIGGPNKKWGPNAYQYLVTHHKNLMIIEANSTYRGWFIGGNQTGNYGADNYVPENIAGHGALGNFMASGITFKGQPRSTLRMGDSPSVAWLLHGDPSNPATPSWGGQFVRAWPRPYKLFTRVTRANDSIEAFGVLELSLAVPSDIKNPQATMIIENQTLTSHLANDGTLRIRFTPKQAKRYRYVIHSTIAEYNNKKGQINALPPAPASAHTPALDHPNWWTDNPAPEWSVNAHQGAATISQWRKAYLDDFSKRIRRCDKVRQHNSSLIKELQ